MAIIIYMDDVPLFETAAEALSWSSRLGYGLTEYHTHKWGDTIGYMAGKDHAEVYNIHTKSPILRPIQTTPSAAPSSSSMGGGY